MEIQQGDFYYVDSALIKVESFIGNEVNPVIDKEDVMGSINIKNLKSVMLTPTILKTIGFEKNPNNRYVLYSGIYVVEAYFNVGTNKNVQAFPGCCEKLSVVNATVAQTDILVSNAIIDITRPDLVMTI
jgi:hypothetical protein